MKLSLMNYVLMTSEEGSQGRFERALRWEPNNICIITDNPTESDQKLLKWLQDQCSHELHQHMRVKLRIPGPDRPGAMASIESSLFSELQAALHQGDMNEKLKLKLSIKTVKGYIKDIFLRPSTLVSDSGFRVYHHILYEAHGSKISPGRLDNHRSLRMDILLKIDQGDFFPIPGLLTNQTVYSRKMLYDYRSHDLVLISNDGTRIPCHKLFLTNYSQKIHMMVFPPEKPIIPAPVDGNDNIPLECKSTVVDTIELKELSEDGIRALLEFIYCRGLTAAKRRSVIALELTVAAVNYEIEALTIVMFQLLMRREKSWFNVLGSLQLYLCLRENPVRGMSVLKAKLEDIIYSKREELGERVSLAGKIYETSSILKMFSYNTSHEDKFNQHDKLAIEEEQ